MRAINLNVDPGAIAALVGPSGSGKSTLLRIGAGLVEPSGGEVAIDRAGLGFTFQDPTLLPWRNVQKNAELLLELRGAPLEDRRSRARAALSLVGLNGFEDRRVEDLSGGMKMRLSLARWLTIEPRTFLFDEPFAALDEITRFRLNDELLALHGKIGFSSLFVTHSIAEAVYLSSRIVVLTARPGRIAAEIDAPFAYPRQEMLRYDAAFAAVCKRVSEALRDATGGAA